MDIVHRRGAAERTIAALADAARREDDVQPHLLEVARRWLRVRSRTADLLPRDLKRDSAWSMLLELFVNEQEGGVVYVKQLMITSGESPATAMRLIDRLECADLIVRIPDAFDHRRVIVQLSRQGRDVMLECLSQLFTDDEPHSAAKSAPVGYAPRRGE